MGVPPVCYGTPFLLIIKTGLYMACSPSLQRKTWCRGAARRLGILSSLTYFLCSPTSVIDPRVPQERDTMLSAAGLDTYSRHGSEHVEGCEASKLFLGRSLGARFTATVPEENHHGKNNKDIDIILYTGSMRNVREDVRLSRQGTDSQ